MKEIKSVDFEKEVLKGGKVVLDFYSTECPPCDALAPKFEALSTMFAPDVKFFKIFRRQTLPKCFLRVGLQRNSG